MFDVGEGDDAARTMSDTVINDVVHEAQTKLIYVYDFFNMWTFFVELAEIIEEAQGVDYPNLLYVHGQIPTEAPQKAFEADEDFDDFNEFDDDLDIDDYDNLDFDENWN
jgi:hypothetical protein